MACELTILMPCLNEAETLAVCIGKARDFLTRTGINGEIVIADNGSTDGSQAIAIAAGARVVAIAERGYGSALRGGIAAAQGRYVIMGDSDDSYDFSQLDAFIARLRAGDELVMGNRFLGGIAPGAMPKLHRYLGNPILTAIGRMFFHSACGDFHCGLRGFDRAAILRLDLQAPGMEFASEMVVKASIGKLRVTEVPTTLSPDGRTRPPHLRSWRDGWRHLRFLLLFSPRGLFLYPGAILFAGALLLVIRLYFGPIVVGRVGFDINTMLYACSAAIIGWQSIIFWVCAKIHGRHEGIVPPDPAFDRIIARITLERSLLASLALLTMGLLIAVGSVVDWGAEGFRALDPSRSMRPVMLAVTIMIIAIQTAYGAMFAAVLNIRRSRAHASDTSSK